MNDFYYRKVDAYKLAKELARFVYALLLKYPEHERYNLCDQLRRAIISVPSNIAEGLGRFAIKERVHFLDIANGSLTEALCQIEISHDNQYITDEDFQTVDLLASRVSMTIYGLKKSLVEKMRQQNIINNPEV